MAACTTAGDIGATAIISASKSGETARLLSRFRPDTAIIACVLDERTRRQMNIYRGITPLLMGYASSTDELISMSVDAAEKANLVHSGDLVVVTAGVPVGVSGTTNMIKIHLVGNTLLAGVGIGQHNAKGEVCVCRNAAEAEKKFKPGQILVLPFTTNTMLPYMKEAAGIITEEARHQQPLRHRGPHAGQGCDCRCLQRHPYPEGRHDDFHGLLSRHRPGHAGVRTKWNVLPGFCVDHTKLLPGMYLSRQDGPDGLYVYLLIFA